MAQLIIYWGSIAGAITALISLLGIILKKLNSITQTFNDIKEHTEENYLNNLRLVIMSPDMPIEERLNAGERYVKKGGNGQVKAFYRKLQNEYDEYLENGGEK